MNRLSILLSCLALATAAATLGMLHRTRNSVTRMNQRVEAAVQGQKSDLEKWASRLRQGRGIPIPVKTPRNLSGVHRLEWTDRSMDLWGWDEKKCRAEGGEDQESACRFAIADRAISVEGHAPSWPDPRPRVSVLHLRFEEEFRRIQAEVSSAPCREGGALSACEIGVELDLPTLQGVGELVGRLAKWPFVLSGLRWENGKLSLRGYLVLR